VSFAATSQPTIAIDLHAANRSVVEILDSRKPRETLKADLEGGFCII
jgi:hypothetical protein